MLKQAQDPRPEPAAAGEIIVTTRFVPVGAVDDTVIMAVMVVLFTTTTLAKVTPDGPFTAEPVEKNWPVRVTLTFWPREALLGAMLLRIGPWVTVKQPAQVPTPASGLVTLTV